MNDYYHPRDSHQPMTYIDYLIGEAWMRGALYTPGNGYATSKRWRGWLHMLIRLLPHIHIGRYEGQPFIHFTLIQIPSRGYGIWAIGLYANRMDVGWRLVGNIGEY